MERLSDARSLWQRSWHVLSKSGGFTYIELLVVAGFISLLAAIAMPLYVDMMGKPRIAKARSDARGLASAVTMYQFHMNLLPGALNDLTVPVINRDGQPGGPFIARIPTPPSGWRPYVYSTPAPGTFTIATDGDGTSVTIP